MLDNRDGGRNVTDLRAGGGSIGGNEGQDAIPLTKAVAKQVSSAPMPPAELCGGGAPVTTLLLERHSWRRRASPRVTQAT